MSWFSNTPFNDSLRGLVILIIAVLVVCPLSILLVLIPVWQDTNRIPDWFLIAAFAAWMLLFFGGISAMVIIVTRQRKAWLDAVFGPLGLTGQRYMINWWEYTGIVHGRAVTIRFYRGPTLDLSIETPLKTRFGITERDQAALYLANLTGRRALTPASPALRGLNVFALDEKWMVSILNAYEIEAPLLRLMKAGETWALVRQVVLLPGALRLTLYRNKNLFKFTFSTEEVHQWLDDLLALARLAESYPEPAVKAEESRVEAAARTGKLSRYTIWIVLGLFGLCALGFILLFVLLIT